MITEQQDKITRDRIAQELDKNFIVEAAAGTGKTTSLVNRMVALVETRACRIDQLAAVTFTRKAAAELKERFQARLRERAAECSATSSDTNDTSRQVLLSDAADRVNQAFVGTIHSFCARLLRERPIEFAVDPAFRELDESEDYLLKEQAWHENISCLIATADPLLDKLRDVNINRAELKHCFDRFVEYRDIQNWPVSLPTGIDIDALQQATKDYIDHMATLVPFFPDDRGTDKLMDRYERMVRASRRGFSSLGRFFDLLQNFDTSAGETQKFWPAKELGIKKLGGRERDRWKEFRTNHAGPGMIYWSRYRYSFVVDFLRRAVQTYEHLKLAHGGLGFQDLLLSVASGLKDQPELRTYFQGRYRSLLVDEFQDTDPLQAQMMLYFTSSDPSQTDWTQCVPNPGSLFLVGDPKQSIYRFRRGDIITYNKVKQIICNNDGEVLPLVKNFRSQAQLIQWNNTVYSDKFGQQSTAYSPAAEDMIQGREDAFVPGDGNTAVQSLCGTYRLMLPTDGRIEDARDYEADSIAKFIRHAIDSGMQVARTQTELDRGRLPAVQPRDFLVIPRGKKGMHAYTEALERHGIPYQVSGGNPLGTNPQLTVLIDCLRAIDDPTNPVHYLAVLRKFLGFSDHDLYQLKHSGGSFNYNAPIPETLDDALQDRYRSVVDRLRKYQAWMRTLPYAVAVTKIATDLGVLSAAASSSQGDMQAGGLLKAIEWLRNQSWDFDSATDLIQFLDEVLESDDTDACPALPSSGNVVRLMNLHKAKGLEAPIVFLADTVGKFRGEPSCHIDRSSSAPAGYMGITAKQGEWKTIDVATPENWSDYQAEEKRFVEAENDRLLYVATTRAACATIISVGKRDAKWADLYGYLNDASELQIPASVSSALDASIGTIKSDANTAQQIAAKWTRSLSPSYTITTAKKLGLKGKSRPNWEASGDYGHHWGSAVHELLELCYKSSAANLRPTAVRLAADYNIGIDRIDELVTTAQAVTQSDIWKRAQAATRCYSELPFETTITDANGQPQLIRGVIDLVFEESGHWVIVDYKTDDITKEQIDSAVTYYQDQLSTYANHWTTITGLPCKELGLYMTKLDQYVPTKP